MNCWPSTGTAHSSRISRWLCAGLQSAGCAVSKPKAVFKGPDNIIWDPTSALTQDTLAQRAEVTHPASVRTQSRVGTRAQSSNTAQCSFQCIVALPSPKWKDIRKMHPDVLLDCACLRAGITAPLSFSSDPLFRELPTSPIKSFLILGANNLYNCLMVIPR